MQELIILWKKLKSYFIPQQVLIRLALGSESQGYKDLKKRIIEYLLVEDSLRNSAVINFLRKNPLHIFPYPFIYKYKPIDVVVKYSQGFPYVVYEGKKLFFKKNMNKMQVMHAMNNLLIEQDEESAHHYYSFCSKSQYGVIIDCGAAEGIFALKYIDLCEKMIIIETDPEWIAALQMTFSEYERKVSIIGKYVGERNDSHNITLDTIIGQENVSLIKVDVDGSEEGLFNGLKNSLTSNKIDQILLCVYHDVDDYQKYTLLLDEYGFKVETHHNKMIFLYGNHLREPFLTNGVVNFYKA
ncbi:MAG: hypothetical protein K1X68_02420 [Saprospiraceae bacterium]|nr:hypothetical protein [Saprospiraceae bacterium]MBX7175601.1 hypothetical protein [Saprospiraceae bacterium]HMW38525.1 hypothetical protein [Saprospiraceae bacterium]HMX88589.1 hypothetical protein [Saprospiraceae bacterium]HMZ40629.1 hypothetical protein [Saprospiraceae bacterium]